MYFNLHSMVLINLCDSLILLTNVDLPQRLKYLILLDYYLAFFCLQSYDLNLFIYKNLMLFYY